MAFELIIRNGTVVDGSGLAAYRGDVGISGGRIARIGRIDERGHQEIDAEGLVVTPGFIDGHTHMDAQVFWDELGTNSCWHGVTSVLMGNCGFTLAPSRPGEHKLVIDNLERAEDIPATAMAAGIDWSWESFPEYLEAVDRAPKAINYAAQVGHSALRTAVMGERAFGGTATEVDLKAMAALLVEALSVGAFGFSTSISDHHFTPDGRPIASRSTSWEELSTLVDVVGQAGFGVFQLAVDTERAESEDRELAMSFWDELRKLAVSSRVPTTYGLRHQHLQAQLDTFDAAAAEGGLMFGQCETIASTTLLSFATRMPFDQLPEWSEVRALPLAEQAAVLRDPARRATLVGAIEAAIAGGGFAGTRRNRLSFERFIPLRAEGSETIGEIAARSGVSPTDALIDCALESDLAVLFRISATPEQDAALLTALRHPRTVMTFGDSGAHVTQISGGDHQTTLLSHWVREREVFSLEEAVRMITLAPALAWKIPERGLLREGMVADVNIFDPNTVSPGVPSVVSDLPGGARRIRQQASGFRSTIVGGVEVFASGEHTGALPGQLIRGPLAVAS
jgi:N-acyl-D-aspartate/D-glutamate deacylase